MIDTHSHIYDPPFATDIDEVVSRAREAGVRQVLLPNINAESIAPMMALCARHPAYLRPMMGLHPEDVKADYPQVLDRMEALLADPLHPYIAVGEVGLDYYWDKTFAAEQRQAFERQIGWAERHGLPLMIHTRAAHADMVEVMSRHAATTGVFHCFGGTADEARQLLQFPGFMLGIGGVLTYKKSPLPQALAEAVPLTRIVLETDAPYLAPAPHRGKRNEPSFLPHVVERLAEVYGTTAREVERQTTANARRVFPMLNDID
ncbi:MAG: TatD family hydrolase [Bacteroidaceae bacterium]|nr:TatD family hydrolase [Bacteroidaceae bacterium]